MENLPGIQCPSKNPIADLINGEIIVTEFPNVTVSHELGPYGRMLGLAPRVSTTPDPEFLVRLLTDDTSHQAFIRQAAGDKFKNLVNLVRGRHRVSQTTKQSLASQFGVPLKLVEELEGSAEDGPLIPKLLALFHLVEIIPRHATEGLLSKEVPCACCGKNMLGDTAEWWVKHAPGMGPVECHFAERLLIALLGVSVCERLVRLFVKNVEPALENLAALANPLHHPIGNWLYEAMDAISCDTFAEVAIAMQLRGGEGAKFSHGRLRKWSSGQDVMPLKAGRAIAEACDHTKSGERRLIAARAIALVTDFVSASLPANDRKVAQAVVHARLLRLNENFEITITAKPDKQPQRLSLSGIADASPTD